MSNCKTCFGRGLRGLPTRCCETCNGTGEAASPVQGAASASGAKGAAVKPWQERIKAEDIHKIGDLTFHRKAAVEQAKDAEIADWRALAERAQAAQPSGAVAEFLTSLLNDRIDVWSNYVWMVEESKAGPDPILGTDEDACRERISKARAALAWLAATPAPEQKAAQVKSMFVVSMVLRQDAPGKVVMKPVMSYRVADTDDAAIGSAIKWATSEFPGWEISSHQCVEVWKDETGQLVARFTAPEQHPNNQGDHHG